jgi:uncharacterized repeat protein (TIGR01451 family)
MDVSMTTREKERRDYGIIIILILLLGFICIILASGWALRFAPSWKLNTNMGSNLDPNSDFLTSQPVGFLEPLDPSILTQPAWIDIFLTPGISLSTRTPLPTSTATLVPVKTSTPVPTLFVPATNTLVVVVVRPTNTQIYYPPPPSTSTPQSTASDTPVAPLPSADMQISKTDGVTTYNPSGTLTYTVTVRNNGADAVTGAVVTDNIPAQIATWSWTCTSQTGGATGCIAVVGSNANFANTVNLPNGASIVYTVTANISASATGNLTNRATINVPAGYTDPTPRNNSGIDTDTPVFISDLGITKTDGVATYIAGGSVAYTITVSNPSGPNNVVNATVTDIFSTNTNIASVTWTCSGVNGGTCVASGSGNINDNTVDLPVGASVTYSVNVTIAAGAAGNLTNTANVAVPAGYTDPTPGNNSAIDTDALFIPPSADLQITKTDNATDYDAGISVQYIIVVSNPAGPSNVTGATVTDAFSANLVPLGITWTCAGSGGASCTVTGAGNINDSAVNLPIGTSVTYTVNATVIASPTGPLVNTATVNLPVGTTDPDLTNNSATDSDQLVVVDATPPQIGTNPDGTIYNLSSSSYLTLPLNITVNGHSSWDLAYYERPSGSGVALDWIIVQIGDGKNWYTVFYWGDNYPNSNPDTNTNMDFNILPTPAIPPFIPPQEPDQRDIPTASLYTDPVSGASTGIAIDLDGIVPSGNYSYIRFFAPPGDTDGHTEIDAYQILP